MGISSGPRFTIGASIWVVIEDLEDSVLTGRVGTVIAIAETFDSSSMYAVRLYPDDICYDFLEMELVAAVATG